MKLRVLVVDENGAFGVQEEMRSEVEKLTFEDEEMRFRVEGC